MLFTLLSADVPDTSWMRLYGGYEDDWGYSIKQTRDGGFIVTGESNSFVSGLGRKSVYLVRTDNVGDTLWTKTYNRDFLNTGMSLQQTNDGGFIIAGNTGSTWGGKLKNDVYVIRTDTIGDTLWTKTYGGDSTDEATCIEKTSDGGFIITGGTASDSAGNMDVYLIRINSIGDTVWTRTYGGDSVEIGNSVQQTSDGGFVIAGYTNSFGAGNSDVFLIRTNKDGDTLWTKTYGGDSLDIGNSIREINSTGFIITGLTRSYGAGLNDVYFIRTDNDGDTLWTKTHGGENSEAGRSIQETGDGGFIIIADFKVKGSNSVNFYMVRTNSTCDTLWTKILYGSSVLVGNEVQMTFDESFAVVGTFVNPTSKADVIITLIDGNGNLGIQKKPVNSQRLMVNRMKNIKTIEIYDLMGRKIKTLPANADVSKWQKGNGVYVVRYVGKNRNIQHKVVFTK